AYAFHEPKARVHASDLSPEAVAVARRNAEFTGLASRVEFRSGDLFAPFDDSPLVGACDLVSCNPPYISTAKVATMPAEISQHGPRPRPLRRRRQFRLRRPLRARLRPLEGARSPDARARQFRRRRPPRDRRGRGLRDTHAHREPAPGA